MSEITKEFLETEFKKLASKEDLRGVKEERLDVKEKMVKYEKALKLLALHANVPEIEAMLK